MNRQIKRIAAGLLCAGLLSGCSDQPSPRPLTSSAFSAPRSDPGPLRAAPGERATPAVSIPLGNNLLPDFRTGSSPHSGAGAAPTAPPPAAQNASGNRAGGAASTLPSVGATSAQYVTLGGVVAEVNGTPIYANKVIAMLERDNVLQRMSQQLDPSTFRGRIDGDIRRTINELVQNELLYAAASRTLDADDRRMADAKTIYWRQQQITRAGGSIELARRKARENGADFEEMVEDRRRGELISTYEEKHIFPRIQVLAADIREYYDKNVDKQFSEAAQVTFHLLVVDIRKTGSKEAAINKVNDKHKRARAGEDFAEMARRENDDSTYNDLVKGKPSSFSIVKVREALPKLQPGEVSDIIEDGNAFYIIKLEARQAGRVRPFEEAKVQQEIRYELRRRQYLQLRTDHLNSLLARAIVRPERDVIIGKAPATDAERHMLSVPLEMAMQKYAMYAPKK